MAPEPRAARATRCRTDRSSHQYEQLAAELSAASPCFTADEIDPASTMIVMSSEPT